MGNPGEFTEFQGISWKTQGKTIKSMENPGKYPEKIQGKKSREEFIKSMEKSIKSMENPGKSMGKSIKTMKKIHGKSMEISRENPWEKSRQDSLNPWKIHGKKTWKIHGNKSTENPWKYP